ncbi:BtpA/SgcQ family protein [Maribellus maritimus]|uniref:BtpA/SgcQ family protein n=1 Tax=Maribellus maritimus TaxID=2870838 RepID=UPI001EEC7412|nr:BtpA/SgcQ family protein [Maribellus maritimus]MCG6187518.1 BtpA/SgcQ family protein [Maribellus maritimus]
MKFSKSVIGMIHLGALPGTPKNKLRIAQITKKAVEEATLLREEGVDAIMIENMHDRPYLNREVGPEVVAGMTAVAVEIKKEIQLPAGIQILAGANKAALAVALATGLSFIRVEGFVFGHMADEGWINSDAGDLLRYRKQIGAEHIPILTDIKKKHSSHALTSDISLEETAKAAEFFLSDGLIVTGKSTGEKAEVGDVAKVKKNTKLPVIIGSGVDQYNIHEYWDFADAFIVGSFFKKGGYWENNVDRERVKNFMQKINQLRT